jgi:regulator of protease activity HflC (stomatin/prohibitin superfamily)
MPYAKSSGPHPKTVIGIIVFLIAIVAIAFCSSSIFETNQAGYLQVKQAAVYGTLTCRTEPGLYGQWFGDIHTYKEAETFYFTADEETGERRNQALPTRYNDGAKALVSGSLRVVLPHECDALVSIHRKFHSMPGMMQKLVLPAVRKALFSTGPHMSAGESYAERRGEFAALAEDQLRHGVIMVDKKPEMRPDLITGVEKRVWVLLKKECGVAVEGATGTCINGYIRDPAAFEEFHVSVTNFVIDSIEYPAEVLGQIETQRNARMNVITQQAQAKEAEARASKAGAEALAQVAETRAIEEVKKTQIVVAAEAKRDQARLDKESALLEKAATIARGEGEAEARKLLMMADGALQPKLDAWLEAQKAYAQALATAQPGALVPTVIMGAESNRAGSGSASGFMELLMVKSAKDLALDMHPRGKQ